MDEMPLVFVFVVWGFGVGVCFFGFWVFGFVFGVFCFGFVFLGLGVRV